MNTLRRRIFGVALLSAVGAAPGIAVAANLSPVARPGVDRVLSVEEGTDVVIDGSNSSDADGSITSFRWRQVSGPPITIAFPRVAKTRFAAPVVTVASDVVLSLTVTDNVGATDTENLRITFNANNQRPRAHAGFDKQVTLEAGRNVKLNGTQTADPDGTIASYAWTQLPGGPRYELQSANQPTATFTMPALVQNQTLSFRLRVVDNQGASDRDDVTIVLHANTPLPTISSFTISATQLQTGQAARLKWSSANATSCLAEGAWTGTQPPSGSRVVGPFAKASTRTFKLTCIGAENSNSATSQVTVKILEPTQRAIQDPPPPSDDGSLPDDEEAARIAQLLEALCRKVGCTPPPAPTKSLVPKTVTACARGGVRDVLGEAVRNVASPYSASDYLVVSSQDTDCALPGSTGPRPGTVVTTGVFENGCPVDDGSCSAGTVSQTAIGYSSVGNEVGAFVRRFTGYDEATESNFDQVLRVTGTIHSVDSPGLYARSIVQQYDGETRIVGLDGTKSTTHFSGFYGQPGNPFLVRSTIRQTSPLETTLTLNGPLALETDAVLPCSEGKIVVRHKRRAPEQTPARLIVDAEGKFIGGSIIFETSTKAWIVYYGATGNRRVQACAPMEGGGYDCGGEWDGTYTCGKALTSADGCGTPVNTGSNPNEQFFVSPLGAELGSCPLAGF